MAQSALMKGVDGGKAFIKKQKGEAVFSAQGKEVAKTKGIKVHSQTARINARLSDDYNIKRSNLARNMQLPNINSRRCIV